jgi:plastocyanin
MRLGGCIAKALVIGAVGSLPVSAAHAQAPITDVQADGNFLGVPEPLRFDPRDVTVPLGGIVRWTNTDAFVPHTATEDHGLWNQTGTFGATGATPPGFGPGETRQMAFAASTWSYFCEVHPADMKGTVTVPLRVDDRPAKGKKRKKKGKRRAAVAKRKGKRKRPTPLFEVVGTWGPAALPRGQVFEVQRSLGDRPFATVLTTSAPEGSFKGGPAGTPVRVRVRVRADNDPSRAAGYSPVSTITVG